MFVTSSIYFLLLWIPLTIILLFLWVVKKLQIYIISWTGDQLIIISWTWMVLVDYQLVYWFKNFLVYYVILFVGAWWCLKRHTIIWWSFPYFLLCLKFTSNPLAHGLCKMALCCKFKLWDPMNIFWCSKWKSDFWIHPIYFRIYIQIDSISFN